MLAGRALNKVANESWKVSLTREVYIKGALLERSVRLELCQGGWRYSGQAALKRARCPSLGMFNWRKHVYVNITGSDNKTIPKNIHVAKQSLHFV